MMHAGSWKQKKTGTVLTGLLVCLVLLGSSSCGSWSGNPPSRSVQTGTSPTTEKQGTVDISFQGTGAALRLLDKSLPVIDKSGASAGSITVQSLQLILSEISLQPSSSAAETPKLVGPFVVDLLNNTISPQPAKLTLPEGNYKNMALQLRKQSGGSVRLVGTWLDLAGQTSPVNILLDADDTLLPMTESQVIQVTAGSTQTAVVSFELNKWFDFNGKDIDLSAFAGQAISIDANAVDAGKKLHDTLFTNVKTTAVFDKSQEPSDNIKDPAGETPKVPAGTPPDDPDDDDDDDDDSSDSLDDT